MRPSNSAESRSVIVFSLRSRAAEISQRLPSACGRTGAVLSTEPDRSRRRARDELRSSASRFQAPCRNRQGLCLSWLDIRRTVDDASRPDFFPAYITEFMNFVMIMFSELRPEALHAFQQNGARSSLNLPRHGRLVRPSTLSLLILISGLTSFARGRPSLYQLTSDARAVLRTALLTVLDA